MYGVPKDLDLDAFIGATLTQVGLGQFDVQFHFSPVGEISVVGRWELTSATGKVLDAQQRNNERENCQLHRLLGEDVVETVLSPPDWFALRFSSGFTLTIFDDDDHYESATIQPGNIVI